MARTYFRVKFPCGLEIEQKINSYWIESIDSFSDVEECPLHGKNCKDIKLRQLEEIKKEKKK